MTCYFEVLTGSQLMPGVIAAVCGRMKVIAFLTAYAVVDRIIRHPQLTFAAEKPPPYHVLCEIALTAAEESGEYE